MRRKVAKRIRAAAANRKEYRLLKKEYARLSQKEKIHFWNRVE